MRLEASIAYNRLSDGAKTPLEAKKNLIIKFATNDRHMRCDILYVLHPDLLAVIPTILIDVEQFQVCLYDCQRDVLLISGPVDIAIE